MYSGDEFLAVTKLSENSPNSRQTSVPPEVLDEIGDTENIAWFVDGQTGRITVVPAEEVFDP
jgi:hypothetical protein